MFLTWHTLMWVWERERVSMVPRSQMFWSGYYFFFACIWKFKLLYILFDRKKIEWRTYQNFQKWNYICLWGQHGVPFLGSSSGAMDRGTPPPLYFSLFFYPKGRICSLTVLALLIFFIFFLLDKWAGIQVQFR